MDNNTEIVKAVQSKGFFTKENWLSPEDLEEASRIVMSIKPVRPSTLGLVPYNLPKILTKLCKFDIKAIYRSIFFLRMANKLRLKNIAEKIFNEKAKLHGIDFYYNPQSEKPVLNWHCDTAYSDYEGNKDVKDFIHPDNYSIKFFFYLTDVSSENGCLSYIPTSNKITYALKKGIFEGRLKYSPYWSLHDYRNTIQKKEYYDYIKNLIGEDVISKFLDISNLESSKSDSDFFGNSSSKSRKNNSENIFDNEIKKGGAIIFNESGIHRGSKTKLSYRAVFRFFYKRASQF